MSASKSRQIEGVSDAERGLLRDSHPLEEVVRCVKGETNIFRLNSCV